MENFFTDLLNILKIAGIIFVVLFFFVLAVLFLCRRRDNTEEVYKAEADRRAYLDEINRIEEDLKE